MELKEKKRVDKFECSKCEFQSFETFEELLNHSVEHGHTFFTCVTCSILFHSNRLLMKHNNKWHNNNNNKTPMPSSEKQRLLNNRRFEFKRRRLPHYKEYQKKYKNNKNKKNKAANPNLEYDQTMMEFYFDLCSYAENHKNDEINVINE